MSEVISSSTVPIHPQLIAVGVILDSGVVVAAVQIFAVSCHVNISISIDGNGVGPILQAWSVVASYPQFVTVGVILDSGIVRFGDKVPTGSCYINIARRIHGKVAHIVCCWSMVILSYPQLITIGVILDCGIIAASTSRHIDITIGV